MARKTPPTEQLGAYSQELETGSPPDQTGLVFGNVVNLQDFRKLASKARDGDWRRIAAMLSSNGRRRVQNAWQHTEVAPTHSWDVSGMERPWNRLVSGDPDVDHRHYLADRHLAAREGLVGILLACGTGHREIAWAQLGVFDRHDAFDLSEQRIAFAKEQVRAFGLQDTVRFRVADLHGFAAEHGSYDVVLAEQSLHHFTPMRRILRAVSDLLRAGGLFFLDEFVGPTRFQWTTAQLEATNELLATLPERYRLQWHDGRVRQRAFRPSKLWMILRDPSEAVDSAAILPGLQESFDMLEVREYGGTILHLLFENIAHNFLGDDQEPHEILEACYGAEDIFLAQSGSSSDFAVVACMKRGGAG